MPWDKETAAQAGQKSKRGPSERTKLLNDLFDPEQATAVFIKLQDMALQGDLEAIKVYMAYCFGKPKEQMDLNVVGGIQIIMKKADGGYATK